MHNLAHWQNWRGKPYQIRVWFWKKLIACTIQRNPERHGTKQSFHACSLYVSEFIWYWVEISGNEDVLACSNHLVQCSVWWLEPGQCCRFPIISMLALHIQTILSLWYEDREMDNQRSWSFQITFLDWELSKSHFHNYTVKGSHWIIYWVFRSHFLYSML